jgi:hypothetical protein
MLIDVQLSSLIPLAHARLENRSYELEMEELERAGGRRGSASGMRFGGKARWVRSLGLKTRSEDKKYYFLRVGVTGYVAAWRVQF